MDVESLIVAWGALGIILVMFLESSILPIPSEIVFVIAGALSGRLGMSYWEIAFYCSIGSALGGMFGYFLGANGARPILHRFGKYVFLTPERLEKMEDFAKKHGLVGVFIGRLTPIVPFKVFSIASGISKVPFWGFVFFTFAGTFPRAYVLTAFGYALKEFLFETVFASIVIIGSYVFFLKWRRLRAKKDASAAKRRISREAKGA